METEQLRARLNSELVFEDWKANNEYKSVSVLVIYWQDSDTPGFKEEAYRIGELFSNDFNYDVEYFAIPLENSHRRLDTKINSFLEDHGDPDRLMIIHYGGHGDADDVGGQEKLAVWAAHSHGDPVVDWSIIQPKLGHVRAEILVLLDCCFAAQAARANQKKAIPSNVELLAACAMRVKTVPPGPRSFTTQLIKQLRAALDSEGYAKISSIHNALAHRDSGFKETPIHFSGLERGKGTIRLERFNSSPAVDVVAKREAAWLNLRLSLRDMLTENRISDIIQWLKAHPTRKGSRLTVENVVLSTENLHQFIHDEGRGGNSAPKFDQLPPPAKHDILTAWGDFRTLLAGLATQLRSSSSATDEDTQSDKRTPDSAHNEPQGSLATLLDLEQGLLSLQNVVQRSVMALPDLYGKREALMAAIEDTAMRDLGFVPLLNRRLKARFPSHSDGSMKTDHVISSTPSRPEIFRSLVREELRELGPVLVEYKVYDKKINQHSDIERLEVRIRTLAELLQTRGPPDFHTLRCTRWFHEPNEARFGLVFDLPVGYDSFKTLRELIQTASSAQKPTLGQRFSMVKSIGEALSKWHTSADWVHQGIASHNIIFFKPDDSVNFDYTNPYLCGFEFARPSTGVSDNITIEDFEMNLYRHPSRQGAPSKYATKKHDLYSYGILMFEVGIWDLVGNCFDPKLRNNLSVQKMQDHIMRFTQRRLGHHMGAAYGKAATKCLSMDFGVEYDDDVGSKLAKAFDNLIVKNIGSGARLE